MKCNKMKKITEEINEKIKFLYIEENLSGAEVAKRLNVSASTVLRRLKKMEIPVITHRQAGIFEVEEVIELYKAGTPIHIIADMFKSSQETISNKLKANNIIIPHGGLPKFNQHIFDKIDSEEKAYWLGFIYADGYIATLNPKKKLNHAFSIGLAIIDAPHLSKFNSFMQYKGDNVRIFKRETHNKICEGCRWDISNEHLWYTLNNYGCTPRKSLTMKFPQEEIFEDITLIRHFIRGYFDGDGSLSYFDKAHKYPTAGFVGTFDFLAQMLRYLPAEFSTITIHIPKDCSKIALANYAHKKAFRLLSYLYNDSSIYLERKKERFNYFCRSFEESDELLQTNIGEKL